MYLRSMLLCCVVLTGVTNLPGAMAQSQPSSGQPHQSVHLTNGAFYQGELVELVPGDHVTLRLVDGEIKRFAWSDIQAQATLGTDAVPSVSATPSVSIVSVVPGIATPNPLAPPLPSDLVQLHFQATDPAAILFSSRATGADHFNSPGRGYDPLLQDWTMVCPRPPCDLSADRRLLYSIQGPSIIRSLPFTLPQGPLVTLDGRVSHQGTRTLMTWLSVIGSASALTGIILLTFGAVQDTNPVEFDTFGTTMPTVVQQRQDALNKQKTFYTAGAALLGGGALLAITGIVAASMLRTSVKFYSDGQLALRLPGKARLDLAPLQVRF